jgi:Kip1 ubiquitination-promoting complex protein 1
MFPRLLKGKGFAQDAKAKEGDNEPSEVFAALLRQFYESDTADGGNVMSEFINKLFNNLNWTVSELEVAMRNLIQSTQNVFAYEEETQTLQRRCSIMFELSVSLLRLVEAISLETPRAILDEELNIARICELLLYVVSRTTTGPNASIFESVTSLDIMRVGRVSQITRFAILAPVVGILLNLHRPRTTGTEPPKYDVIDTLLATAQFTMETLDYIAGLAWSAELSPARVDDELRRLDEFMQDLKNRDAEKKDKEINTSQSADEEGELCPICYADVINTTFLPCKHQSCKRCIQRHMLQSKTCFFCKADVASLEFA